MHLTRKAKGENTMTFQTLELTQIQTSNGNPRKRFDEVTISGLAQSIKTDGLLQNLVVSKPKGKKKKFTIISGERRFRAMKLLSDKGDLPKDFTVPVEVKEGLSDEQTHRIATIENVQRENLPPLEEAEAVASLLQDGMALTDVSAQTGLSEGIIRRRLALSNLCDDAKKTLTKGEISLTQAEALTLGTEEQQKELISEGLESCDADRIKHYLTEEKSNVAMAIFDVSEYSGTFTSDLFASDDTTYFDDSEQFLSLQEKAVEKLVETYKTQGFEPVELVEGYGYQSWKYRPAEEDEKGGVVIALHSSGRVDVHEGIINRDLDSETDTATFDNPFAEAKVKATYGAPLCKYMAMHKSGAVQSALLENPRKAKELVLVNKLYRFKNHACLSYFEQEDFMPPALLKINEKAKKLLSIFAETDEQTTWRDLGYYFSNGLEQAYDAVQKLSDEDIETLLITLEALEFGQIFEERLDTNKDSLFNRIAHDLNVDMRDYWRPDEAFLKRRNKEQLQTIITESGSSLKFGSASQHKKKDLVAKLSGHFKHVMSLEAPNEDELKAVFWLPEAMAFPAVNPDIAPETSDNS